MQNTPSLEIDLNGAVSISAREFDLFRALIYQQTGITLGDTKTTMLTTRLSRRMRQLGIASFDAYYQFLKQQDPQGNEYREFINSVTTNKTSFFRENHHFEFLSARLRAAPRSGPLRIWSAACSTGEEPYSIGMTMVDTFGSPAARDMRILASDIDTSVLQFAETGIYSQASALDIPPAFRQKFLSAAKNADGPAVQVSKEIRDLITFRCRNLVSSSWGINVKFDFIFCRNVLIYFDHATQDQILRRFLSFLKPGGFLVVGHSEHLHWLNNLIEPAGQTIYRLRQGVDVS
jgi:chemotaxis protein methyltransferase CheR